MRKLILIIVIMQLALDTVQSQDKVASITTKNYILKHPSVTSPVFKAEVNWTIYKDSLIQEFVKGPIYKRMNKLGVPTKTVYNVSSTVNMTEHIYQVDNVQVKVVLLDKRSVVSRKEKDPFTGDIKEELFY